MRLKRQGTQLVSELQMRTSLSQDIDGCRKDTTMGPKETSEKKKKLIPYYVDEHGTNCHHTTFLINNLNSRRKCWWFLRFWTVQLPKNSVLPQGELCTELSHLYSCCLLKDLHMEKPRLLIRAPCQGLCPKSGLLRTESNSIQIIEDDITKIQSKHEGNSTGLLGDLSKCLI